MENKIFQFKITLNNIHPLIWRRFQVLGSDTLLDLHDAIQKIMGWEDYHLHEFVIENQLYGDPENDEFGDFGIKDETEYRIDEVVGLEGQQLHYKYDFGDNWEHTLVLEKILEEKQGVVYPCCLKGKRACPPEDVGGIWGYHRFLQAIHDPDHPENDEYLTWAGEEFDPEAFDLDAVNFQLKTGMNAVEVKIHEMMKKVLALPHHLEAQNLVLRKDAISFLTYLQENRVTGTQSTGNLTRKAVREIAARFINPPKLEYELDGTMRSFQSEFDVWPVFFIHLLLASADLLAGGQGRRWVVTEEGKTFLKFPEILQVWTLLFGWWFEGDWFQAYHLTPFAEYLLPIFKSVSLKMLLEQNSNEPIDFKSFVERLIEKMNLAPDIEDREIELSLLTSGVQNMLVKPMEDFGLVQTEYQITRRWGWESQQLHSFKLTPFGKAMLETLV